MSYSRSYRALFFLVWSALFFSTVKKVLILIVYYGFIVGRLPNDIGVWGTTLNPATPLFCFILGLLILYSILLSLSVYTVIQVRGRHLECSFYDRYSDIYHRISIIGLRSLFKGIASKYPVVYYIIDLLSIFVGQAEIFLEKFIIPRLVSSKRRKESEEWRTQEALNSVVVSSIYFYAIPLFLKKRLIRLIIVCLFLIKMSIFVVFVYEIIVNRRIEVFYYLVPGLLIPIGADSIIKFTYLITVYELAYLGKISSGIALNEDLHNLHSTWSKFREVMLNHCNDHNTGWIFGLILRTLITLGLLFWVLTMVELW